MDLVYTMFTVRVPCLSILQTVVQHCCLPYMSTIHEITEDGSHIHGIELQLPSLLNETNPQTLFFWADPGIERFTSYEAASLQALIALQRIYGFVIADYNIHGLLLYRTLSRRLLPIANRGVQLARLILASSHHGISHDPILLSCAEDMIREVNTMPTFF